MTSQPSPQPTQSEQTLKIIHLSERIKELEEALEPFAQIGRRQDYRDMGGAYAKAAEVLPVPITKRPRLEDFLP